MEEGQRSRVALSAFYVFLRFLNTSDMSSPSRTLGLEEQIVVTSLLCQASRGGLCPTLPVISSAPCFSYLSVI